VNEGNTSSSVIDETNNANQQSFILHRIIEVMAQLENIKQDNRKELDLLMIRCLHNKDMLCQNEDCWRFNWIYWVDKKLNEIDNKISELNQSNVVWNYL